MSRSLTSLWPSSKKGNFLPAKGWAGLGWATEEGWEPWLPKSRQRLLQVGRIRRTRTKNEFYALLMHTLLTGGNLNCGTDGGLRINKGTFGLVISVEDKVIWEGCGPVDGNPETASSKRSELFGYAGLLEVLLLMDTLMLPPKDDYPSKHFYRQHQCGYPTASISPWLPP